MLASVVGTSRFCHSRPVEGRASLLHTRKITFLLALLISAQKQQPKIEAEGSFFFLPFRAKNPGPNRSTSLDDKQRFEQKPEVCVHFRKLYYVRKYLKFSFRFCRLSTLGIGHQTGDFVSNGISDSESGNRRGKLIPRRSYFFLSSRRSLHRPKVAVAHSSPPPPPPPHPLSLHHPPKNTVTHTPTGSCCNSNYTNTNSRHYCNSYRYNSSGYHSSY